MKIKSYLRSIIGLIAALAMAAGMLTAAPSAARADGEVELFMSARIESTITVCISARIDESVRESYDAFVFEATLEDDPPVELEGYEDGDDLVFEIRGICSQRMSDLIGARAMRSEDERAALGLIGVRYGPDALLL